MTKPIPERALNFIPRDAFAELNLAHKNAYLQELADRYCALIEAAPMVLTKDALSRLRRFYARRSMAELHVDNGADDPLSRALRGLAENMKQSERRKDVIAAIDSQVPPKRVLRAAPENDEQFSFFVPRVYDAPIKDDLELMDVAPFALSKHGRIGKIDYNLKDAIITITSNPEYGLATVFDYDIFLHMVTHLVDEMKRYRINDAKGLRPVIPPPTYRPAVAHILKFCRRDHGGRQYKDLIAALDRLQNTIIKVNNLSGGRRRENSSMPLIGSYKVVSQTATGRVDEVEISIPDWVYNNIVSARNEPKILTLNPDYFLISRGLGRMLYRLARKAAGRTAARYSIAEIHKRSGSAQALPQFTQTLRHFVASTETFPLPDYDLRLVSGRSGELLMMTYREGGADATVVNEPTGLPLFDA